MRLMEINQGMSRIEESGSFIYPIEKPSDFERVINKSLSVEQKTIYTLIIELEIEKERVCSLLSQGRLSPYESLLSFSILNIQLEASRGLLWTSLYSNFEGELKPGENEVSVKKNLCLCISYSPNGYEGEKKIIHLSPPD